MPRRKLGIEQPKAKSALRTILKDDKKGKLRVIINIMERAVSNHMLNDSASLPPDLDTMFECDDAENLVVWAFRRWVLGLRHGAPEQWHTVWRGLQRRCGEATGREATAALAEMIEELRRIARRTITHHEPCCPDIGDDEATLLVLIGACQRGDVLLAQTAAQALSGTLNPDALTLAAMRFAEAFHQRGLMLPYRDLSPAITLPAAISLH
jgi:hypothetical protein